MCAETKKESGYVEIFCPICHEKYEIAAEQLNEKVKCASCACKFLIDSDGSIKILEQPDKKVAKPAPNPKNRIAPNSAFDDSIYDPDFDRLICTHCGKRINTESLEAGTVLEIAISIAKALKEAEKFGIVHRDIKPENIMFSKEERIFKLADLGLARQASTADNNQSITMESACLGTPLYMSPEQAIDSKSCDIRSDFYSLGVTLYQLLSGNG